MQVIKKEEDRIMFRKTMTFCLFTLVLLGIFLLGSQPSFSEPPVKVTKKWFTDGTGRGMIVDESDSTVPPKVCYFLNDTSPCIDMKLAKEARFYSQNPDDYPLAIGWLFRSATEGAAWNGWIYIGRWILVP